jgi:hypothetical protein
MTKIEKDWTQKPKEKKSKTNYKGGRTRRKGKNAI